MNIIQIQDRLKGLPDQALVNYVEQPMGEVPIYLALGELQRRKEMKERFQATQADKPSVAEQLVAESKPMQMGLGAMAPQQMMPGSQGVGTPPPAPEIDPRQLAASGIAANPQSAVGGTAMMKEGGIVGYAKGGEIDEDFIKYIEAQRKANIAKGVSGYGGVIDPSKIPDVVDDAAVAGTISSAADKTKGKATGILSNLKGVSGKAGNIMKNNKILTTLGLLYGANSIFGGDDGDELKQPPAKPTVPTTVPNISTKNSKKDLVTTAKEQQKLIEDLIGVDTAREDTRTRAQEKKENALNMALIRGGLGMASGQSANFIDNLAAGATSGVESFAETTDEVDDILANIDKQQRAEEVAIATKALDMSAKERELEQELEIAKITSTGQTPGGYYSVKQQNKVSEALGKDQDYQNHKILATQLRAKSETQGGLSPDDLATLNQAETAMKIAEDDVYLRFNMTRPQPTVSQNNQVYNVDY